MNPIIRGCWRSFTLALSAALMLCIAQAVTAGETITYFHNEVIGSPVVATDVNGFQVWKETYRPYGDQLIDAAASQNNKIGFAGKPFDDSTGLSYMGARYYDPTLGRFMAVDPVSFSFDNLHSFNRYAYANNNPYMYVDPDGEAATVAVVAGGAAVMIVGGGCIAAGSCEKFGRSVWNFGRAINERLGMPLVAAAFMASGRLLSEATGGDDAPAEGSTSEKPSGASGDGESSVSDAGTRTPAPFLPDDPYSPEETSKRQSETRRQEGASSLDPDSPVPDRGPGRDIGGHPAREGTPHTTKERNVNPKEEHSRRTKRDPGGGPRR